MSSSGRNPKNVVIIGALDTKGMEFAFIKDLIEKEGIDTLVVDFGTMGDPDFEPEVKRAEVAAVPVGAGAVVGPAHPGMVGTRPERPATGLLDAAPPVPVDSTAGGSRAMVRPAREAVRPTWRIHCGGH